ncbi:hypothetical protein ETC01_05945 [Geobacillus sp. NFOSA3]|uniref:Uncharacterized protein n=1 Tax=Parageobacillus galactosidasius TaxID=883812 RepID=A0A226QR34_9BACL|nr:hypothetical protein [Geobacillus sp. NFOSA3]OQO98450.1 hypothetical protein B1689_16755 [Geobacillus sp. 44C]OXB94953.1 hypothetical protein B9L23_08910 [Parageobacillus galactosidasius]
MIPKEERFSSFLSKKVSQKRTLCEHFWDTLFFFVGTCCQTHNECINAHKKSTTLEIIYSDQKQLSKGWI